MQFFFYVKSIEQEWNMSQETEYSSKILRFEDIIHICIIYIANLLFSLKINTWSGVIKITKRKFPENFWKTLQNFTFLYLIGILYYSFKLTLD